MKIYFLDTNIILDFLADRKPFSKFALRIFDHARTRKWELWTSSHSITTAYYILEKELGNSLAKEKIGKLLQYLSVQPIYKDDLLSALNSRFQDFEDGVQHNCALKQGKIDAMITRNQKDFRHSQILILGPEEVVGMQA